MSAGVGPGSYLFQIQILSLMPCRGPNPGPQTAPQTAPNSPKFPKISPQIKNKNDRKEKRDRELQKKTDEGVEGAEVEIPARRIYFSIVELKENEGAYGYNGFRQMVWKELENLEIMIEKKES